MSFRFHHIVLLFNLLHHSQYMPYIFFVCFLVLLHHHSFCTQTPFDSLCIIHLLLKLLSIWNNSLVCALIGFKFILKDLLLYLFAGGVPVAPKLELLSKLVGYDRLVGMTWCSSGNVIEALLITILGWWAVICPSNIIWNAHLTSTDLDWIVILDQVSLARITEDGVLSSFLTLCLWRIPTFHKNHNCFIIYKHFILYLYFVFHSPPIMNNKKIQMTAWLSTELLSFSAADKSRVTPKFVHITQCKFGSDIVWSTVLIKFCHWYCAIFWRLICNDSANLITIILIGSLVNLISSWVLWSPLFWPYLGALIHCNTSITIVLSLITLHSVICNFLVIPHSWHILRTHFNWRKEDTLAPITVTDLNKILYSFSQMSLPLFIIFFLVLYTVAIC